MAFHNVKLSDEVEQGAQGGPSFDTSIIELSTGVEKRNINWQNSRGIWDIGFGLRDKDDIDGIRDFFFARQGMTNSFRFKDWSDFELGNATIDSPLVIATGDNSTTVFPICKIYESGGIQHIRRISKPVVAGFRVFLDGVEQFSGFTIDDTDGAVNMTSPPGAGVALGIIGEFDVHVRFDDDEITIDMENFELGAVPSIGIIEIRETITVTQNSLAMDETEAVTIGEVITIVFASPITINIEDAITIGETITIDPLDLLIFTSLFNEDISLAEQVTVTLV